MLNKKLFITKKKKKKKRKEKSKKELLKTHFNLY